MRDRGTALWLAMLLLAGCGGGGGDDQEASVFVYRSLESRQCEGGGKTLASIEALAQGAGVHVIAASCGSDGLAHVALCGAGDGRIAILEIPGSQDQLAWSAGFAPASSIPFVRTPCA